MSSGLSGRSSTARGFVPSTNRGGNFGGNFGRSFRPVFGNNPRFGGFGGRFGGRGCWGCGFGWGLGLGWGWGLGFGWGGPYWYDPWWGYPYWDYTYWGPGPYWGGPWTDPDYAPFFDTGYGPYGDSDPAGVNGDSGLPPTNYTPSSEPSAYPQNRGAMPRFTPPQTQTTVQPASDI
jgi:hypothetical protein